MDFRFLGCLVADTYSEELSFHSNFTFFFLFFLFSAQVRVKQYLREKFLATCIKVERTAFVLVMWEVIVYCTTRGELKKIRKKTDECFRCNNLVV